MTQPHIAYCGFNCAACPVFHAAARGSGAQRQLALRRVRHAHMRRGARPCTLCRMRRISLRHCGKKPALRQRRPRGAGHPALKRPVLWRFARPLFCAKNAACTGRASTEKHAFFAGAIKSQPQA